MLVEADPEHWSPEILKWEEFGREAFVRSQNVIEYEMELANTASHPIAAEHDSGWTPTFAERIEASGIMKTEFSFIRKIN